jgi:hypothetical protein
MGERAFVEIRVRGSVGAADAARVGLHAFAAPPDTVLRGTLPDRSALHGALERLRCGGLEIVDVRPVAAPPPARAQSSRESDAASPRGGAP